MNGTRTRTDGGAAGGRAGVRALTRGLAILRHVNSAGECRPGEIATALGIPRPTVYRLLATLEEEGYVVFSASANRVRVTRLAASLGDGSALASRLCQVAGQVLGFHAPRILWPLNFSLYQNAAMVVQETTHGRSPLSVDRGMVGYRMPMLRTSAGRAYLGHCSPAEQAIILDHIRRLADPDDLPFLEPGRLAAMLAEVAACGMATRFQGEFRAQTSSLAVPVIVGGRVEACVSIILIRSAVSQAEAVESFAGPLREIAGAIAAGMDTDAEPGD